MSACVYGCGAPAAPMTACCAACGEAVLIRLGKLPKGGAR